jgi:hypothetical protein
MPEVFLRAGAFVALVLEHRRRGGPPLAGRPAAIAANHSASRWRRPVAADGGIPPALSRVDGSIRASCACRCAAGVFAFLLPRHYVDASGAFHETAALWERLPTRRGR